MTVHIDEVLKAALTGVQVGSRLIELVQTAKLAGSETVDEEDIQAAIAAADAADANLDAAIAEALLKQASPKKGS
jgi:histone H3/H4